MNSRNIIVVGASSGGFEAIKTLVSGLPPDLPAAMFVVWHMSPDVRSLLPQVLNRSRTLNAVQAEDRQPIEDGRIYVAPPDRHLLVENGYVRVTRGPKENRFRPAIDPLFRSAAHCYGPGVIGVILSGALDDGTSGLWTVKHRGGVAIVQHPDDAEVASMPENAIREVDVDHVVPVSEMANLLTDIIAKRKEEPARPMPGIERREAERLATEIGIAAEDPALEIGIMDFGELTAYTCPECHGVLSSLREGNMTRFRCHTGHGFTVDSLIAGLTQVIEDNLWSAVRSIDESIIFLNHMGDHFADVNQPRLAALYFRKAKEAQERNEIIRKVVMSHEQFSMDTLRDESETENTDETELRRQLSAGANE